MQATSSASPPNAPESCATIRSDASDISIIVENRLIFVTLGSVRKVFSAEEMKRLVRICYGAQTKSEALHQLFTVLVKERRDVLADAMIGSPDNPLLRRLFDSIRETYHLEDR